MALLAILSDAAVGHAVLWENDPYWTYWITKTFLIATVFGLGTAWFGVGIARGAVITAVHTFVLTIYYWSLSPIGLPSHPEWLDLQHTWVPGLPVHFGVIYLGYLAALGLWRRPAQARTETAEGPAADAATAALVVGVAIVLVGGGVEAVAIGDADLRLLAQDPPPATVHWLSYRDEWLVAFPITVLVAVTSLVAASAWQRGSWTPIQLGSRAVLAAALATATIAGLGGVVAMAGGPDDQRAIITSVGRPSVEQGEYCRGTQAPAEGELRLVAQERNPTVTPLPPHDEVDVEAAITHPNSTRYEITATQPMVDDPEGRFGTWWGVGLDRWHHGRSGIGTSLLPATRSEVAVFAHGEVRVVGELVASAPTKRRCRVHDGSDGHCDRRAERPGDDF